MLQGLLHEIRPAHHPQRELRIEEDRPAHAQARIPGVRVGVRWRGERMKRFFHGCSVVRAPRFVEPQQFGYDRSMEAEPDLARIAATVGDPRRIQMLALLMEGRALTAKELALGAGVEPATASAHLKRLLEDGLVESAAQGRHKYFRFASDQVAQMVESLMRVAPRKTIAVRITTPEPLRRARYCYDHLAGTLG